MKTDLLEDSEPDVNNTFLSFSINTDFSACIHVLPELNSYITHYVFTPDDSGIVEAEKLISALQEFIRHVKDNK